MAKIIGNTTATPMAVPDWNQTDETKADYIKNKPAILTEGDVVDLIVANGGAGGSITIDGALSETSENPVQNKVIKGELDKIDEALGDTDEALADIIALQESLIDANGDIVIGDQFVVQANWAQTDDSKSDYIKNKPFDTVDEALDLYSTNPVQNCVVTRELSDVHTKADTAQSTANAAQEAASSAGQIATYTNNMVNNDIVPRIEAVESMAEDVRDLANDFNVDIADNMSRIYALETNAVLCTAQTLTDAQKSQARKNIDFTDTVNNMIDSKIADIEGREGEAGATFTPSVSEDGVISWTNDKGLENPESVSIRGKDGDDGQDGADGQTPYIKDGNWWIGNTDTGVKAAGVDGADGTNGTDGKDGVDGVDGVGISKTEINAEGKLVVTYTNGITETLGKIVGADGKDGVNGADGTDGQNGADGKSAYETAKDGGYTGTEAQFAQKLAMDVPTDAYINSLIDAKLSAIPSVSGVVF